VSASVTPAPMVVGESAVYAVTVRNTGGTAADVVTWSTPP
jgi:uncharacterized repeat protein (TIGR01451 family)